MLGADIIASTSCHQKQIWVSGRFSAIKYRYHCDLFNCKSKFYRIDEQIRIVGMEHDLRLLKRKSGLLMQISANFIEERSVAYAIV